MSQRTLGELDHILGVIEIVGSGLGIAWLVAYTKLGRTLRRTGLGLALVLAVTLVQPWGVRTDRVGDLPAHSRQLDAAAGHRLDVAGVPLFWFKAYVIHQSASESGEIDRELKVRSWVVPPILTNASKVTSMCGGGTTLALPCFPSPRDPHLRLWRAPDGAFYYTTATPSRFVGEPPTIKIYRASVGFVSLPGLLYWCVLALFGIGRLVLRRSRHSATTDQAVTRTSWSPATSEEQNVSAALAGFSAPDDS